MNQFQAEKEIAELKNRLRAIEMTMSRLDVDREWDSISKRIAEISGRAFEEALKKFYDGSLKSIKLKE